MANFRTQATANCLFFCQTRTSPEPPQKNKPYLQSRPVLLHHPRQTQMRRQYHHHPHHPRPHLQPHWHHHPPVGNQTDRTDRQDRQTGQQLYCSQPSLELYSCTAGQPVDSRSTLSQLYVGSGRRIQLSSHPLSSHPCGWSTAGSRRQQGRSKAGTSFGQACQQQTLTPEDSGCISSTAKASAAAARARCSSLHQGKQQAGKKCSKQGCAWTESCARRKQHPHS